MMKWTEEDVKRLNDQARKLSLGLKERDDIYKAMIAKRDKEVETVKAGMKKQTEELMVLRKKLSEPRIQFHSEACSQDRESLKSNSAAKDKVIENLWIERAKLTNEVSELKAKLRKIKEL